MKLTILGSGVCSSGIPTLEDRFPPAYTLDTGDGLLQFDCGEGARLQMTKANIDMSRIHHLCISHPHPDHNTLIHFIQSMYCIGLFSDEKQRNNELHIYTTKQIIEDFPVLWDAYLPELKGKYSYDFPELHFTTMENGKEVNILRGVLKGHHVYHAFGRCEALAFTYTKNDTTFGYTGDMGYTEDTAEFFKGTNALLSEASSRIGTVHDPQEPYGHMTPQEAGLLAHNAGAQKLILTHYQGHDSDQEMIEDVKKSGFTGEVIVGKDLMNIDL